MKFHHIKQPNRISLRHLLEVECWNEAVEWTSDRVKEDSVCVWCGGVESDSDSGVRQFERGRGLLQVVSCQCVCVCVWPQQSGYSAASHKHGGRRDAVTTAMSVRGATVPYVTWLQHEPPCPPPRAAPPIPPMWIRVSLYVWRTTFFSLTLYPRLLVFY